MLVAVDGDPIVYRVGHATQDTEYHVVFEDDDGTPKFARIGRSEDKTPLKNLKEFLDRHNILEYEEVVVPEEINHVLSSVRGILRDIQYAVAEQFEVPVREVRLRIILSGPGNFRERIATCKPYKGNRKDKAKPYWYQQIRNYLTQHWGAEVVEGREADDELAILQYNADGPCCIATIDKDLDMVPGHHYDYNKKTFYYTTEPEGLRLFYQQVLSGDSTDNIPGVYRLGPKSAECIVMDYLLEHPGDYAGLWELVVDTYRKSIEKYGEACCYYQKVAEEGEEAVALEMARLVWMQQYPGQLWTPPGHPDELIEDEDHE